MQDWQRQNDAIREQLIQVQNEIMNGAGSPFISSELPKNPPQNSRKNEVAVDPSEMKKRLEEENRLLLQIVEQVKADLQQATTLSPTTSYATPL